MKTLNNQRTYGVEVEFISNEWSRGELIEKINTKALSYNTDTFRMPKVHRASWSDTTTTQWRIKTDSSVGSRNGFGLELVSPILEGDTDMYILKIFLKLLNELHCDVNRSCGLHVHVGVRDWGVKQFKNLAKRYVKFETAIDTVMPSSRNANNNQYCLSNARRYGSGVTLTEIFASIQRCRSTQQLKNYIQNGRYYKLNMESFWKHGTIEFRHHSGTICPDKIENWVFVCMGMTKLADNNRAVKVKSTDVVNTYKDKLSIFMNGLSKSGLIDSSVKRFYTKRARALCTS